MRVYGVAGRQRESGNERRRRRRRRRRGLAPPPPLLRLEWASGPESLSAPVLGPSRSSSL